MMFEPVPSLLHHLILIFELDSHLFLDCIWKFDCCCRTGEANNCVSRHHILVWLLSKTQHKSPVKRSILRCQPLWPLIWLVRVHSDLIENTSFATTRIGDSPKQVTGHTGLLLVSPLMIKRLSMSCLHLLHGATWSSSYWMWHSSS